VRGLFVTGTDTEVGKTWVSVALLRALAAAGLATAAMKPIASGAIRQQGRLVSEDAVALADAATVAAADDDVNPYRFEPPVAPHLAAEDRDVVIRLEPIRDRAARLAVAADVLLVEGVGGWKVPLGPALEDVAALARGLDLPVVLVVGVRLGCISHALLTAEAIARDGCRLAGWVANRIAPETLLADRVVAAMAARIPAPLLGDIPQLGGDPGAGAAHLDRAALLRAIGPG
jgi:dethiobiotin synthetase